MPACCAYGCPNRPDRNRKRGVTFHKFPKEASLRQQWTAALRRKDFAPTKWTQICSEHFEESVIDRTSLACVRLREGAVPTIFLAFPSYLQCKVRKRKPPTNRTHFQNKPKLLPGPTIDMPPPAPDFFPALEVSADMATPKKKLMDTEGKLVSKGSITPAPATIDMPPPAPNFFPDLEASPDVATPKRQLLDTEGKLVSKRSITLAAAVDMPQPTPDFFPALELSPDESTLKRNLLDTESKLKSSRKKIKLLLQTKRRLTKKIADLTTALNQQRKNEMIGRQLWDDSHKYHQPAMMMETMLDLDREVYDSWCNIGAALSLTTNSQIAHYLVDYFQEHELESKNCLTCGAALTLHCAFCSNRKSSQNDKLSTKASEESQGQNERHAVKMVSSTTKSDNVQSASHFVANEATNGDGDQSINIHKLNLVQLGRDQETTTDFNAVIYIEGGDNGAESFKLFSLENLSSSIMPDNNQQQNLITAKIVDVGDYGKSNIASKRRGHQKSVTRCEICKKIFSSKHYLKIHKNNVYDRLKPFKCDICSRSFGQLSTLQRHKFTHVDAKPHQCGICGKRFTTLTHLKYHAVVHSGLKDHVCELCGTRFSFSKNLLRHKLSVHNKIKRFACDICNKAFTTSASLQVHMIKHSSIPGQGRRIPKNARRIPKNAVCETCGKSFYQSYMKIHKMIHTGEKPHVCQVCGRSFTHSISYKEHMHCHNGDKPYVCKICNKSFSFSSALSAHKIMHTNPEQLECEVCKQKFKSSWNLHRHKKNQVCSSDMNVKTRRKKSK